MFTKQTGEEEFRILGPEDEEGATVEYGDVATLKIEAAIYYALASGPDDDSPVMCVQSIRPMPTELEEVDFEDADDDGQAGEPLVVETEATGAPELVE